MSWSVLPSARHTVEQNPLVKLRASVHALNLPREATKSLIKARLQRIGQLVQLDQKQLLERLQTRNGPEAPAVAVHHKEIDAVEEALHRMSLRLGTKLHRELMAEFKVTLETPVVGE